MKIIVKAFLMLQQNGFCREHCSKHKPEQEVGMTALKNLLLKSRNVTAPNITDQIKFGAKTDSVSKICRTVLFLVRI